MTLTAMDATPAKLSTDALEVLLSGPLLTPATRQALEARLRRQTGDFQYFSPQEGALLEAVGVLLVPHDPAKMPLARQIDARLLRGDADGWRYDSQPPDGEAYRALLGQLPADFQNLSEGEQTAALVQLQQSDPRGFEDLLAELTEGYYADPRALLEAGSVAFADAHGWQETGLNRADANEEEAWQLLKQALKQAPLDR